MAGPATFDNEEFQYPKPLIEINGKPMIELVIDCFRCIKQEKRFIFLVNSADCQSFYLDDVLRLVTDNNCVIIKLEKPTRGAACTALMAIEYINNPDTLIISNSDHIIDYDLNLVVEHFQKRNVDAGTICFESIHPKWSFVRLDKNNKIVETAEKRPLSRNAIAGFYYFRRGSDFVSGAMKMIQKDVNVAGKYFTSFVLNELVLKNMNLEIFLIPSSAYHNFYSPHLIREYNAPKRKGNMPVELTEKHIQQE
jgi:NDP-sugar pyrophosphorylase family protein